MSIEKVYCGNGSFEGNEAYKANAGIGRFRAINDMDMLKLRQLSESLTKMRAAPNSVPRGTDALTLFTFRMDKTKHRIVLEDETTDSVYLKIVKK